MRVCSFNINGLTRYLKRDPQLKKLMEICDVVCLQETKLSNLNRIIVTIPNCNVYLNSSKTSGGYCGLSFIFKQLSPTYITNELKGFDVNEARYFECDLHEYILINVYVPNADITSERYPIKERFLYFLNERIEELKALNRFLVIVGDFNIAHTPIDSYYSNQDKEFTTHPLRNWFSTFLTRHGLVDTFRHFYPDTVKYSCWNTYLDTRSSNSGARIDYILVSQELLEKCNDCQVLDHFMGSDHCPVVLDISIDLQEPLSPCTLFLNYSYAQKTLMKYFDISKSKDSSTTILSKPSKKRLTQSTLLPFYNIKKEPVKCNIHSEICNLKQVIKTGPNKGRYFYCCSLPFSDKCNFFQWQKKK